MSRVFKTTAALMAMCLLIVAAVSAGPSDGPPDRPEGARPPRERGPRGPEGEGPRGFRPPPNPFMEALDLDKDGEISAEEIENAVVALKSMDENEDGKLSHDEVHPQPPHRGPGDERGPRGPRDPEGARGPGGPPGEDRPRDPKVVVDHMMSHDKDGDDKISREEAPERMARLFDVADTDGDDALSRDELTKALEKRMQGRGKDKGKGKGKGKGDNPGRPDAPPEA
ncbi:MAG: hypothetical protein KDA93_13590 [Planctomycetaceae bacterium]|nr:hypothetical protein [Planctomycetaceae bacterium]